MLRVLPILLGLAVIAAGTIIQGDYADRWDREVSEQLQAFADRVPSIPMQVGEWECIKEIEISDDEWAATNCEAYISRYYQNPQGQIVSVYVVAGAGRHITIHTPDQCFVGAGFEMESRPDQCEITLTSGDHDTAQFAHTTFLREDSTSREHVRTLWSYSNDGKWEGPPEWAKSQYGALDAMYKVYITTNLDDLHGKTDVQTSSNADFAREFMPLLSDILFTPQDEVIASEAAPAEQVEQAEQQPADE